MKAVFTSDMHNRFKEVTIPECDILVDSGDYSFRGTDSEIRNFYKWFNKQPAKHLISVQGNHEKGFEADPEHAKDIIFEECPRVNLLHDSEIVIERIKFYGSPWQPEFYNWAYNLPRGKPLVEKWALIPDDTQVLITHGPPYGILDECKDFYSGKMSRAGCHDLRDRVHKLKQLKIHSFGHLHHNGGQKYEMGDIIFLNSAICNDSYLATRFPQVVEL